MEVTWSTYRSIPAGQHCCMVGPVPLRTAHRQDAGLWRQSCSRLVDCRVSRAVYWVHFVFGPCKRLREEEEGVRGLRLAPCSEMLYASRCGFTIQESDSHRFVIASAPQAMSLHPVEAVPSTPAARHSHPQHLVKSAAYLPMSMPSCPHHL